MIRNTWHHWLSGRNRAKYNWMMRVLSHHKLLASSNWSCKCSEIAREASRRFLPCIEYEGSWNEFKYLLDRSILRLSNFLIGPCVFYFMWCLSLFYPCGTTCWLVSSWLTSSVTNNDFLCDLQAALFPTSHRDRYRHNEVKIINKQLVTMRII